MLLLPRVNWPMPARGQALRMHNSVRAMPWRCRLPTTGSGKITCSARANGVKGGCRTSLKDDVEEIGTAMSFLTECGFRLTLSLGRIWRL